MSPLLLAVQLLLAAPAPAAEAPVKPTAVKTSPAQAAAAVLKWTPPAGWDESAYANGPDQVVAYEHGFDRITVRIFGAPKSFYKTPAQFLEGPAATTMGRAPEPAGEARIAGRGAPLYRHEYPVPEGDPHMRSPRPPRMAREIFCVLPPLPDGRFAVVAYARESPVPDLKGAGDKAWSKFLGGVKPASSPAKKR
jgi:hypothetical protein